MRTNQHPPGPAASTGGLDHGTLVGLLAAHYRDLGWWVEHVDADDVDLRLKRDHRVVLLRCLHGHGRASLQAVETMAARMAGGRANGAILVCVDGFTDAAVEAGGGTTSPVRLIDGDALHALIGELPRAPSPHDPFVERLPPAVPPASDRQWMSALIAILALACLAAIVCLMADF